MSTYDISKPEGSSDPKLGDDSIRTLASANQEINNVDHYWPKTGNQVTHADRGKHRQVRFAEKQDDSTLDNNTLAVSDGTVKDENELVYQNTDNDQVQITKAGKVNIKEANALNNNDALQSEDSGDTARDLIKLTDSDVTEIGETDAHDVRLSDACTDEDDDKHVADKKYVDDNVGIATMKADNVAGATFGSGNESATLANGMIIKGGTIARSGATTTVTYKDAFPGATVSVSITSIAAAGIINQVPNCLTQAPTKTGFVINSQDPDNTGPFYWMAIGY